MLLELHLLLRINRGYHDLALIAQHLERYVSSMPAHHQIEDRSTKTQIAEGHLFEEWWKPRFA